jgi:hypothetical protein
MKFRAKIIKNSNRLNEFIEGDSLVKETSSGDYVIVVNGMYWVDGREWSDDGKWEYIDINTLEMIR